MKCLLITSIFPPINGGSAVVYESIALHGPPGSVRVLTVRKDYQTSTEIPDHEEYDRQAAFPIERVSYLRPPMRAKGSLLRSVLVRLTVDLPIYVNALWAASRIARREGIDVVCVGELASGSWLGLALRRLHGCKVINYIHGEEVTVEMPYRRFGAHRKEYLAAADGIVAVSRYTKQVLMDKMGVPEAKIALITNGVDAQFFSEGPRAEDLLRRHGLEGRRLLLSVGRLVERKGIDNVIRALPEIARRVPEICYVVVGHGEDRPRLDRLVAETGTARYVHFAGRVSMDDLRDFYRSCDLFVLANREMENKDTEGFGLVFLEANACGKPAISGLAGGVKDAVRHGVNGFNVDGEDVAAIAEVITRTLTDEALYGALVEGARRVARESDIRLKVQGFIEFCNELAGATAPAVAAGGSDGGGSSG